MTEQPMRFEPLAAHHLALRRDFDCGSDPLNRYLAERARKEADQGIARVHVLYDSSQNRIAGFYALSSDSVVFSDLPEHLTRRIPPYPALPAVLLGRLATDLRYRGQGLGRLLVVDALARVQRMRADLAILLVVVDAKDDHAVSFYERFGFRRFENHERRLYLPTAEIPPLLPPCPSEE